MLARCIARRVTRLRTTRSLARSLYEFAPGNRTTFEESGIPPLYQVPAPPEPEEILSGWDLKSHYTAEAEFNEPELDDDGLLQFYRDMVYSGSEGMIESLSDVIDVTGRIREAERRRMISSMIARLQGLTERPSLQSGSEALGNQADESGVNSTASEEAGPSHTLIDNPTARRPSLWVLDTLALLEIPQSFESLDVKGKGKETTGPILPLGLLSLKEWQALFEDSMSQRDYLSAERVLRQMSQHGFQPVQAWAQQLVNAYAKIGEVAAVDRLNAEMRQVFSDAADYQAAAMTAILNSKGHRKAIHMLKSQEQEGSPLSQKAYQVVLHHLSTGSPTYRPDSHSRALARDLFAHMRLIAHPTPSRELYRDMITACAAPMDPQPERARDLWLEMTTDSDTPAMEPDKEDYNAIIRALCTSKDDYLEGFDIFRQMLSKHQDAVRVPFEDIPRATFSKFIPTLKTFSALLQGTKRVGDLERTRWLVLEMVKLVQAAYLQTDVEIAGPDASVVADIFHAYATWIPPAPKLLKTSDNGAVSTSDQNVPQPNDNSVESGDVDLARLGNPSEQAVGSQSTTDTAEGYTPSPLPSTHSDALREASSIWERVLYDVKAARTGDVALIEYPFSQVRLDQRVVTAFQDVILRHVWDVSTAKELWTKAYKDANDARGTALTSTDGGIQTVVVPEADTATSTKFLRPNGWSYTEALEYCGYPRKMHQHSAERKQNDKWDRAAALEWSKELWQEYLQLLDGVEPIRLLALGEKNSSASQPDLSSRPGVLSSSPEARAWLHKFGLGDRQIERAFKAKMRALAIANQPLEALKVLEEFRTRFPPKVILDSYRPLQNFGLSMHVEDHTSLAEPNVPPSLTWKDLAIVHQALITSYRDQPSDELALPYEKGLAMVKNLSRAYESALFKRRRWRMSNFDPERQTDMEYIKRKEGRSVKALGSPEVPETNPYEPSRFITARTHRIDPFPPKFRTASQPGRYGFNDRGRIPDAELGEVARLVTLDSRTVTRHKVSRPMKGGPRSVFKEKIYPRSKSFGKRPTAR